MPDFIQIAWYHFNETTGTPVHSKSHLIRDYNDNKTLCGLTVPQTAAQGEIDSGTCKRCRSIRRSTETSTR